MNTLPEISEADATGKVADLYETIRAETGSRLVNYIWRHLATIDGAADWAWSFTRLNDSSNLAQEIGQRADQAASRVAQLAPLETPITINTEVQAILRVYNANNAANLARVMLLRQGLRASAASAHEVPPTAPSMAPAMPKGKELPPLPAYSAIAPEEHELIDRMVAAGPAVDSGITPSLWRHLTVRPGLLARLAGPMETTLATAAFRDGFTEVRERAASAATTQSITLPGPVHFDRIAVLDSLDHFTYRIAELAIAGRIATLWSEVKEND